MNISKLFESLSISAQGLSAERRKMNAIASNIANAETTKTENGQPYRRKIVTFQASAQKSFTHVLRSMGAALSTTDPGHMSGGEETSGEDAVQGGVQAREAEDQSAFKEVYDPSHPDADENGYVKLPNVNVVSEMVDMISASRAYEANVTAVNAAKATAKDALDI